MLCPLCELHTDTDEHNVVLMELQRLSMEKICDKPSTIVEVIVDMISKSINKSTYVRLEDLIKTVLKYKENRAIIETV